MALVVDKMGWLQRFKVGLAKALTRLASVIERDGKPPLPQAHSTEQLAAMRARYPNAPDHWLMMLAEGGAPPAQKGVSSEVRHSADNLGNALAFNVANEPRSAAEPKLVPVNPPPANKAPPILEGTYLYDVSPAHRVGPKFQKNEPAPVSNLRPKFVEDDRRDQSAEHGVKMPSADRGVATEQPLFRVPPDAMPALSTPVFHDDPAEPSPPPCAAFRQASNQVAADKILALSLPAAKEKQVHHTTFIAPRRDEARAPIGAEAFAQKKAETEEFSAPQPNFPGDEAFFVQRPDAGTFQSSGAEWARPDAPKANAQQLSWPELPPLPPEFEQAMPGIRGRAVVVDAYFPHAIERGEPWNALPF